MARKDPIPPVETITPATIPSRDAAVLESVVGRENDQGADPGTLNEADIRKPVGAVPRSAITAKDQPGMRDDETDEGLTDAEEQLRQSAESVPVDHHRLKDVPVFDRGHILPED